MIKDTPYKFRQVQGPCKIKTDIQSHIVQNSKDLKIIEILEQVYTRKFMRQRAKLVMKRQGKTKICSNPKNKGSYFAEHWKEAVNYG